MFRSNPENSKYYRCLLASGLGVVAFLSLSPSPPQAPELISWDKLQHALAYAVITVLFYKAVLYNISPFANIFVSGVLAWTYGAFIEFLQMVMPYGRFAEISDLVANLSGAFAACLLLCLSRLLNRKFCHEA